MVVRYHLELPTQDKGKYTICVMSVWDKTNLYTICNFEYRLVAKARNDWI